MGAAQNETGRGVQGTEINAMGFVCSPQRVRLAGIVARPDMALQPLPRQFVCCGVCAHAETDREFSIHDFITVWRFTTHDKEHKQNK